MGICRLYKIPHSEFKSWSESDQGKALAFEWYLKTKCPRCGMSETDWKDEKTGKLLDEPLYRAIIDHCPSCEEMGTVEKAIPTDQRERGLFTRWIPSDDWDPEMDQVIDDLATIGPKPPPQKLILPAGLGD